MSESMSELLLAALVILGVVAVPCIAILAVMAIERLFAAPVLTGRELVAEGVFSHLVHGEIVSTRGLRVITYQVTVVHFRDKSPCLVPHSLLTKLPAGAKVRLWRDPANNEYALEMADQS